MTYQVSFRCGPGPLQCSLKLLAAANTGRSGHCCFVFTSPHKMGCLCGCGDCVIGGGNMGQTLVAGFSLLMSV